MPERLIDTPPAITMGRGARSLRQLADALRGGAARSAAIVAASIALALLLSLLQPRRYTASATIQLNDPGGGVLSDHDDPALPALASPRDTDRFLNTQVDALKSRTLALRVADALNLPGNPHFFAAQGAPQPATGTGTGTGTGSPAEMRRNAAATVLQDQLDVSLPRASRIATLRFDSGDPALAAQIANAFANEFIAANLQRKFDSSAYARGFLSTQLGEVRGRLERSEQARNAYARAHGLIAAPESGTIGPGQGSGQTITGASLLQLNQAANAATARRIEAQSRWRAVAAGPLLGAAEVLANPAVAAIMARRAELAGQLADDRARHFDDYPSVSAKQAELSALDQQLRAVATAVRAGVHGEYRAALTAEQGLAARVAQTTAASLSEQDRMVRYGLLAREVETNRQLYSALLERYKQLNAVAGVSVSNVALIDAASIPEQPSSPNWPKTLALGLICGLGVAAASLIARDQFDDTIRAPEDVEAKLALPLLAAVPRSGGVSPEVALADPKSPLSEAYNALRGALLHATPDGLPQVLLVTSAQPGEGKTTTALALACAFARMGRRTLLIDADLRRPVLHERFGLSGDHGLANVLAGTAALETATAPSGRANLWVLPAGPVPPSPTELLATTQLEALLEDAARAFEVILIDSPPITGLADAPAIAVLADGVVLAIEAVRSQRGALKAALRRLQAMHPVLLGAVLTKFDPRTTGRRYFDYAGAAPRG